MYGAGIEARAVTRKVYYCLGESDLKNLASILAMLGSIIKQRESSTVYKRKVCVYVCSGDVKNCKLFTHTQVKITNTIIIIMAIHWIVELVCKSSGHRCKNCANFITQSPLHNNITATVIGYVLYMHVHVLTCMYMYMEFNVDIIYSQTTV
jgi:hypothetical protein